MDPNKSKTSMIHFSEAHFEKNLAGLKNTQESIQSLSAWCLQHRQHHKKIVASWFKVMKKVKIDCRLVLFYLANDVIQYSKRKNYEFVNTWALCLQRAVTLVRDDKIKSNITRIFKIWAERGIFDEAFIADLTGLLESPKGVSSDTAKLLAEFQPTKLVDKIRSVKTLEDDTDLKLSKLKESSLELTDVEALRANLKDRRHGADHVSEVEDGISRVEAYVTSLREEIKERTKLIDLLEQASVFYDHQRGEAKIVVNAYRNFGNRVKNLKRKLDDLLPTLTSPVPSPDINAPSPSPDSDPELQLPETSGMPNLTAHDYGSTLDQQFTMMVETHAREARFVQAAEGPSHLGMGTSFMGSGQLPFDLQENIFHDSNSGPVHSQHASDFYSSEAKPIEVIGSRNKAPDDGFNISQFLKSISRSEPSPSEPPPSSRKNPPLSPMAAPRDKPYNPDGFGTMYPSLFNAPPPPPPSQSNPMQPSPALPDMFLAERAANPEQWGGNYAGGDEMVDPSYNSKLPPKFPTWSGAAGGGWEDEDLKQWEMPPDSKRAKMMEETPQSPPMFEKEGFNEPVQYDDRSGTVAEDVDHRTLLPAGRVVNKDVDHRNLISLTSSPSHEAAKKMDKSAAKRDMDLRVTPSAAGAARNEKLAGDRADQDYRQQPLTTTPASPSPSDKTSGNYSLDNVESVDMEMSDEENDLGGGQHGARGDVNTGKRVPPSMFPRGPGPKNSAQSHNGPPRPHLPSPSPSLGPRLPMSPIRPLMAAPLLPPAALAPLVKPPPGPSPPRGPMPSPPRHPLLPTPHQSFPQATPSGVQPEEEEDEVVEVPQDEAKNGEGEVWKEEEEDWAANDHRFLDRMHSEEEEPRVNRGRRGHPRARGRGRSNQMNPGNGFGRGNKFQNPSRGGGGQFAGPPRGGGFPNRGFRGGPFRPFRGPRRGNFNRW